MFQRLMPLALFSLLLGCSGCGDALFRTGQVVHMKVTAENPSRLEPGLVVDIAPLDSRPENLDPDAWLLTSQMKLDRPGQAPTITNHAVVNNDGAVDVLVNTSRIAGGLGSLFDSFKSDRVTGRQYFVRISGSRSKTSETMSIREGSEKIINGWKVLVLKIDAPFDIDRGSAP